MRERSPDEVWHDALPGLKVLTTGPLPLEPTELLSSEILTELLRWARRDFDYVLVDAPPVRAVSDPMIVATNSDGILLVVDAQRTGKDAVRESVRNLEAAGVRVLGTVMNNIKGSTRT